MYSNKQLLLFNIFNFMNNNKVKMLCLGLGVILFLFGIFLWTVRKQNFDNKVFTKLKKFSNHYKIFLIIGIVITGSYLATFKVLKSHAVSPQTIEKTSKKITTNGTVVGIHSNSIFRTTAYTIQLNNGKRFTVNYDASKIATTSSDGTPVKFVPFQGTSIDQDVLNNAKPGLKIKLVTPKYDFKFKNHDKYKVAKSKSQVKKMNTLNKLRINSKVVLAND